MKAAVVFTVLYTLFTLVLSQDVIDEIEKAAADCAQEYKINPKLYEDFRSMQLKPTDVTNDFKCMAKCFLEKNGWMDAANANFKPEAYKAKWLIIGRPEANIDKAIETCKDLKAANACDKAYQIISCLRDNKFQNKLKK